MNKDILLKVNTLNNLIKSVNEYSEIVMGKMVEKISDIANKLFPGGKVLILFTERTFSEYSKSLFEILSKTELSHTQIILENEPVSLNNVSGLFNISDDTRGIIVLGSEIFDYAIYLGSIKSLPIIFGVDDSCAFKSVSVKIDILNGKRLQPFFAYSERHIVLDTEQIKSNQNGIASTYAEILSGLLSVLDYGVKIRTGQTVIVKEAYTLVNQALSQTFDILSYGDNEKNIYLSLFSLYFGLADYISQGEMFNGNCLDSAKLLIGRNLSGNEKLSFTLKIISLLEYFLNSCPEIYKTPDYISRTERVKTDTGLNGEYIAKGLTKQINIFTENKNVLSDFFNNIKGQISSMKKSLLSSKHIFIALGGDNKINNAIINTLVKFSGDFPDTFNLATYLRENGILEYID